MSKVRKKLLPVLLALLLASLGVPTLAFADETASEATEEAVSAEPAVVEDVVTASDEVVAVIIDDGVAD